MSSTLPPSSERAPATTSEPAPSPTPKRTLTPSPSPLHYSGYPHLVERIIELSPPSALLAWRGVSHDCHISADRALGAHLVVSQADGARFLEFCAGGCDHPPWATDSSAIRLPSSRGRHVAIQIVDPALLLQRSFAGMLFRLPPPDAPWLRATLGDARQLSIAGDIWYGNRTLPHYSVLVSMAGERVPHLSLLPATDRDVADRHYPSLHPFTAPRVTVVARMARGTRYDRAWAGLTTPLPPACEDVEVRVEVDSRQEWSIMRDGRGRPLDYPPSVRMVHITLNFRGPLSPEGRVLVSHDVFRILVHKLFRGFRPDIGWFIAGLGNVEVHRAIEPHVAGAELETLLLTLVAGISNAALQASIRTAEGVDGETAEPAPLETCLEVVRSHLTIV